MANRVAKRIMLNPMKEPHRPPVDPICTGTFVVWPRAAYCSPSPGFVSPYRGFPVSVSVLHFLTMSSASFHTNPVLTIGPIVIGTMLNAAVLGACAMQIIRYPSILCDGKRLDWLSLLVVWVFVIGMYQVFSSGAVLWHYVVDNFGNVIALRSAPWTYTSLPIFTAL